MSTALEIETTTATNQETEAWEQQKSLDSELAQELPGPIIIDFFDFVTYCMNCVKPLAGPRKSVWRESGSYWVTCPNCNNAVLMIPMECHFLVRT